jgi:hypothetical protein
MTAPTQEDIIRMARKAKFEAYDSSSLSGKSELDETLQVGEYPVGEKVFKLVALAYAAGAAAEREACAKLVDHILKEGGGTWGDAIRARGNK